MGMWPPHPDYMPEAIALQRAGLPYWPPPGGLPGFRRTALRIDLQASPGVRGCAQLVAVGVAELRVLGGSVCAWPGA